ncbi:immunoglobulin-binding protein 1 [Microplitis demolitor]|uniref:immunoglobulin-binding protein 1 n=1 Tax=Microplitis demolitor TaxID=69319 RepID=UPI0004CCB819|nr:immunoglobulin-binding protein 1 [Microplitis demolitor]
MASNDDTEINLSELFDSGFLLFNSIMKSDEPTNSLTVQLDVKKCISIFENATKLVSIADIFSKNEDYNEIPTEHLKYFLLPALLGTLATKICDRDNRMHYLKVSQVYFYDFLERVKSYGITQVEIPKLKSDDDSNDDNDDDDKCKQVKKSQTNTEMIQDMMTVRRLKLQRYKEQKDLKEKLEIYQKSMDNPNIDDETKRNYFITLIKLYVLESIDEINSLAEEKNILEQMAMIKKHDGEESKSKKEYRPPKLQPIIITRNEMQKRVLGAGYPSLPVMTVEEFYEKKVADGEWAANTGPGQTQVAGKSLQDMANQSSSEDPDVLKKEELVEKDDEEYLEQMRAMDEYKDDHKRGWGNRYNRS